jgi:hypothetical protein
MNNPYDLKPLIDQLHEERLREAQKQRLARQARAGAGKRSRQEYSVVAWVGVLSRVRRAALSK